MQAAHDLLSACTYQTCLPDVSGMVEAAKQQAAVCNDAQARWRPSDESTLVSHDTHHLCLMAKKSKKKASKRDQAKEIARVDDQVESDVEVEDNYNLDHLNHKDKFIIMKIVEKNDELEEEIEKQEQSLQKQELFLISKMEELKALSERYEKLSVEHALVTNSSSSISQLEKKNFELKARLDELSSKYNVLQANYVHLKCSHEELVESSIMLEVAHEVVITSVKSSQPLTHSLTSCKKTCARL